MAGMDAHARSHREQRPGAGAAGKCRYVRHRPEHTVLYQVLEQHAGPFFDHLSEQGASLPGFVRGEFDDYLRCGRLEAGLLRVKCTGCRHEHVVAFSCRKRGFCPSCGARRMVDGAASTSPTPPSTSLGWMQRLRRAFGIDVRRCPRCGAPLRVLAHITDPRLIAAIVEHLAARDATPHIARAPP